MTMYNWRTGHARLSKRQRIPKNCYKTIFRKINTEEIFFQLTPITNKDYFSRKKLNLRKFTVAVHVIYIYGRDVTHWCQLWMFVNIVSKYCLFISKSFEYTVYFIVMVYCVAFGCNNNSCSSKNNSFFRFPDDAGQRREITNNFLLAPMTSRP